MATPSAPSGTTAIHSTVSTVNSGAFSWTPIRTAATAHAGVASSHSTRFFAYHVRRSAAGSASAAMLRSASAPSRLVAGTSEYIQTASTIANASGPWNRNSPATTAAGSSVQQASSRSPLITTTMGVS